MGTWGNEPWDNDTAADWFGDLFNATGLSDKIAEGLVADVDDRPEVVRAAAHLIFLLGHTYVWPTAHLREHQQLAVERLQALLDIEWEPRRQLQKELRALRSRLKPPAKAEAAATPSPVTPPGTPKLELLWSRDLATPEQRKDPSGLRWGVISPSVRCLDPLSGNRILAGTHQHLQLLNAQDGSLILDLSQPEKWHAGMSRPYLPTEAELFVQCDSDRTAVRSLNDGDVLHEWQHTAQAVSADVTPGGDRLLVLTGDGTVHVYEVETGIELFQFEHERPKNAEDGVCNINSHGSRAASSWKGSVCFWDLEAGVLIKKHRNKFCGVQLAADERNWMTRSSSGMVLWDVDTGKKERALPMEKDAFTTSGNRDVFIASPIEFGGRPGEILATRVWTEEDVPYSSPIQSEFASLGKHLIATWRLYREVVVWSLRPLQVVAATSAVAGESYRMVALNEDTLLVGNSDAHVYAFRIP